MINSWNKLDIKTYRELYRITSNFFLKDDDKRLHIAALLNGISYDELLEQPIADTLEMMKCLNFLEERPKAEKIRKEYQIGGKTYCPIMDAGDMTTAQYIDYQAIATETFEEHLLDLMSIIMVPKGHIYNDGYDRKEVMADLDRLTVTEALGIADFFIKRYRRSLTLTLLYSDAVMRMAVMKAPKEARPQMRELRKKHSRQVGELLTMFGSLSLKQLLK